MNDFRTEMASVSEDVVKSIDAIASPTWAIPYLGRSLTSACKEKFKDAETMGFSIELPWEGQAKYESHNAYDDSTYVHELVVSMYKEGPAAGRIKSVQAHHWEYWHTTSNWQDHSERATYEKRDPNEQEIEQYKKLLDGWTEGGSAELVQSLSNALELLVQEHDGKIRVEFYNHEEEQQNYKAISISISRDGSPSTVSIVINLDHLVEALDYSRIFIEVLHSKEDRSKFGICKGESWTLQYCLNFFDVFTANGLYQNIDLGLKAWLYKLYVSSSYYRDFMNIPPDIWWRDAWWRLQELVEGKHRVQENQTLICLNCRDNNYSKKPYLEKDPLACLVGTLAMPNIRPIKPFSVDTAYFLSTQIKGVRERYKFRTAIVNGVKWSICNHNCNEVAIDLATSEVVDNLIDDVVVIPYQIEGRAVTEIHMIDNPVEKDWRKIVFAAPSKNDLECIKLKLVTDNDGDDYFNDDSFQPEYEEWLTINEGAFRGWLHLEEVVFERKTNRLCSYAFDGCSNLKKISFCGNRCSIGDRCFQSCLSLVEIGTIKGTVGAESFRDCASLKQITMSCVATIGLSSHIRFGDSAFIGCTSLETVRIEIADKSEEKTMCYSLSRKMFWGCISLREIHIPQKIRILEEECFGNCSPDCVLHYEGDAFWFVGKNALPRFRASYYWGVLVSYEKETLALTDLLDKYGIKRDTFIDTCIRYRGEDYSISTIVGIIMGKKPPRRYTNYHYDAYDCMPRTFDDAYEIYGSKLWDA